MKSRKKKTVLVYGDFNILHPGHIRFLRFASEQGNRLIVGLLSKSISTGADLPDDVRLEAIRSLGCVTESLIVTDSISDLILRTQPDVIVKGKEHEGKPAQELSVIRELGIKLIFSSGSMGHSESELSYRYQNNYALDLRKLSNFLERRKVTYSDLRDLVERFKALKVCVVGDLIVDEYISLSLIHI
jgi:cytidyltransferase-like protein